MRDRQQVDSSRVAYVAARSGALRGASWLAIALLAAPLTAPASPHTVELFQEAMKLAPVRSQGEKLYKQYCLECHGSRAYGEVDKVIPALAGQTERYLVKQLVDFSELDRDTPEMHRLMARPELAQPRAWRDLAAYLASLHPNPQPQVGSGRDVARGERAYTAYCASCHTASGEGLAAAPVPALRGQHYSYLLLQLKSFDGDHRANVDLQLLEHMIGLSRADMEALADYISRLPVQPHQEKVSAPPRTGSSAGAGQDAS